METIRIIIADENQDVLIGAPISLSKDESLKVVATTTDEGELYTLCNELKPDVVIATPELIIQSNIESIRNRIDGYDTKIIAFGNISSKDTKKLLEIGIDGFMPYDASDDELVKIVRIIHEGFYSVVASHIQGRINDMACGRGQPAYV